MKRLGPALLVFACCGVPEGAEHVLVFGHGGMGAGHAWPMDSRESIEACINAGADGVEIDVHLTADSVLIAYHDEDLSTGTTRSGVHRCSGRVNAHRWNDLRQCTHAEVSLAGDSLAFPELLALDSLFATGSGRNTRFTLDCKLFAAGDWNAYLGGYVHALNGLVTHHDLQGRVNIECMDAAFLDRVKAGVPGAAPFLYAQDAEAGIDSARAHAFAGITIDRTRITQEQVRAAHATGLKVAVFGAGGTWSHQKALELGADMIQTDDPQGLLQRSGR